MEQIFSIVSKFIEFVVGSVTEGALKNKAEQKQRDLANSLSEQYKIQTQEQINKISDGFYESGRLQIEEDAKNKIISENLITMAYVLVIVLFFIFIFILSKKSN